MDNEIYVLDKDENYIFLNIENLKRVSVPKAALTHKSMLEKIIEYLNPKTPILDTMMPLTTKEIIAPTIVVGFACNYRCEYCYQYDMHNQTQVLQPQSVRNIKSFYQSFCDKYSIAEKYGEINIIGGEPFLLPNKATLEAISDVWAKNTLCFTTNGTHIEDFFDYIISSNSRFKVSVDGTKEMHYKRRIPPYDLAYERTLNGLKLLLDYGKDVQVITVFDPNSWEAYPKFFDLMEELGWLKNKNFKICFISQFNCGCDDIVNVEENVEAFVHLLDIDSRTKNVDARKLFPGSSNLIHAMSGNNIEYVPYRCSCLYSPDYWFLPDGTVHFCFCGNSSQTIVGRYEPKIEIDDFKINLLKKRRIDNNPKCRRCIYKFLCKGGCAITALSKTGELSEIDCSLWNNASFIKYFDKILNIRRI